MRLLFDAETDGLYNDVTCIHCLCIHDLEVDETYVFNDQGTQQPITKGVQMLEDADVIIGHNIIDYDLPVIKKLFGWFEPKGMVLDTLILSRLYHTDLLEIDRKRNWPHMPLKLYGRHSLEAHGHRLGEYKGEFCKTTDWKQWSQEMENYCTQDVTVTKKLWSHFHPFLTGSR